MVRLQEKYVKEIMPKLKKEFGIGNSLAVPKLTKVVINMGIGDVKDNQGSIDKVLANVTALAGQKPVITKAKKSISTFKVTQGQPIGIMVTLRGARMYQFLDKLISIVLPRVRDFRGVPDSSFDPQGNYSLGLKEQIIFPEVDYKNVDRVRGFEISIVNTAKDLSQGKRLLELLGVPFRK